MPETYVALDSQIKIDALENTPPENMFNKANKPSLVLFMQLS